MKARTDQFSDFSGLAVAAPGASVAFPGPLDSTWAMIRASERLADLKGKRISEHTPTARVYQYRRAYQVHDFVRNEFLTSSTATTEKLSVGDRKEQRHGRRVGNESTRPACPVIHVRRYQAPSWLTSSGVSRKAKLIERKGLPSFKNWRFITLTFCRKRFPTPLEAYLAGVSHMRRFLDGCRKAKIWKRGVKWAWKLEFHQDGYPHWHLIVEHRTKLTHRQLAKIGEIWAMGRANTERIEDSAFGYSFKYAFKPAQRESEHGEDDEFERLAPNWFLDYVATKSVRVKGEDGEIYDAEKPVTFARVRFWQTSKGFYTGRKIESRPAKPQKTWGVPRTVRQHLETSERTVQVIARRSCGKYFSSKCVVLDTSLETFWGRVGFDTMHGQAVGLGVFSFVVPTDRLTTDKKTLWQLKPLLNQNRLTLRQAVKLHSAGQTLRTC